MLSSFLTENLFKKGVAVSTLGQPWGVGFPQPLPCVPKTLPTAGVPWERRGSTSFALTVACLSSPTSTPLPTKTPSTWTCGTTCRRSVTASHLQPFGGGPEML